MDGQNIAVKRLIRDVTHRCAAAAGNSSPVVLPLTMPKIASINRTHPQPADTLPDRLFSSMPSTQSVGFNDSGDTGEYQQPDGSFKTKSGTGDSGPSVVNLTNGIREQ